MDALTITFPALITKDSQQHTFPFGKTTSSSSRNAPHWTACHFPHVGLREDIFGMEKIQDRCQRRSKNASAGRSENTSVMPARMLAHWWPFY